MSSNIDFGKQELPGHQHHMPTKPCNTCLPADPGFTDGVSYKPAGKLADKVALISGGDRGIGRATAMLFALEGASVVFFYDQEDKDVNDTLSLIRSHCGDKVAYEAHKIDVSKEEQVKELHGRIDILVNNAAIQKAAVPHMKAGSSIINNASVNAFVGHARRAIVAFTRSLSKQLVGTKGIRVNAVAPGPIVTPLIAATMTDEQKANFGKGTPMGRPGQPSEVATCFVFLASADSSYISGSTLHPNGQCPGKQKQCSGGAGTRG
ncbi:hypothetical protein V8E36_009391 [Tilletia maclaganii]